MRDRRCDREEDPGVAARCEVRRSGPGAFAVGAGDAAGDSPVSGLEEAHAELTERVMGREGVSGTAIGRREGEPCLLVYLAEASAKVELPERVGGYPVVAEVTGRFEPR